MSVEALDAASVLDHLVAVRRGNGKPECVILLERRGHFFQRSSRQQFAAEQSLFPARQVFHRGIQRTRRKRNAHVDVSCVLNSLFALRVAGSAMHDNRRIRIVARVLHLERRENILLHELSVGLPADLFNQVAQQNVAGIVVRKSLPGLEFKRLVAKSRNEFFRRSGRALRGFVIGESGKTRDSGGVRQQIIDGHFVPGGRRVGHVLLHRVVDVQLSALFEQQDGSGGELFGDRA